MSKQHILPQQRRKARHYAMQAIYSWHMTGNSASQLQASFRIDYDFDNTDIEYFNELVEQVILQQAQLDAYFEPVLDRPLKDINGVELALLRVAVYELKDRLDVPYKVVINEAVSLAKKFGAADSFKYINGILDRCAKHLRAVEVAAG